MRRLHAWSRTLAARILWAALAIVTISVTIGSVLFATVASRANDNLATSQAAAIAVSTGSIPEVADLVAERDPGHALARIGETIRRRSGAAYVVIIGADGTRYSHPSPALIGQRIEEPVVALDGTVHLGIDSGSLGRSANARAPVLDAAGHPIGEVSVGILETEVASRFRQTVLTIVAYAALALGLGFAGSLLLARTIKRITFGLEPAEIVGLVQEREATLHGIREGVVALDRQGRVSLVNDEARRLTGALGLTTGQPLERALPPGRLRDVISGRISGLDVSVLNDDHLLVVNRMPVTVAGREIGTVSTIRDRTELEALIGQLREMESLTGALRAQQHEFSNRMHVITVLLELGEVEEARSYVEEVRATGAMTHDVRAQIASPAVTALLLAKRTLAVERGIGLDLTPASRLPRGLVDDTSMVTVLGNLLDNAIEAIGGRPRAAAGEVRQTGRILVDIQAEETAVRVEVSDSGPGVDPLARGLIFTDGYSTKMDAAAPAGRRGIGLALVRRIVTRLGGTIVVLENDTDGAAVPHDAVGGAVFRVVIPYRREELSR